jgi:hypothetical protein
MKTTTNRPNKFTLLKEGEELKSGAKIALGALIVGLAGGVGKALLGAYIPSTAEQYDLDVGAIDSSQLTSGTEQTTDLNQGIAIGAAAAAAIMATAATVKFNRYLKKDGGPGMF